MFSEQSGTADMQISTPLPNYSLNPYKDDTLFGFLQRPRLINSTTWTDTPAAGARLLRIDPYFLMLTTTSFRNKLENFTYFRAGIRIGVRVNGTKFHYGKLLVAWMPMYGSMTQGEQERRDNIITASGYPHVIISPTENEINELVMPFAYPDAYLNLSVDKVLSPGVLAIYVLNPLALDAAVPPVSVSVFANFEDVELAGTTGAVNLPIHTAQTLYDDPLVFVAQGLTIKYEAQGKDIKAEAMAKSGSGLISGPAKAVSSAAGFLSNVPVIGSWASAVGVISSSISSVAEHFGYCKPNTLEAIAPRHNRRPDFSNTEGLDTAMKMQIVPSNDVTSFGQQLGGTEGEMEIQNIVSTPSLYRIFTWEANDAPEDVLFVTPITPTMCHTQTDGAVERYYNTPLRWISTMCQYWRGSLRFDLQITCSNFHSGRFRISFMPYDDGTVASLDHQNCINRIVDIQNETEVSFTVPYIARTPWLRVFNQQLSWPAGNTSIGTLQFTVINELTHASSPIPEIHLNLWVSAGPDFQIAMPHSGHCYSVAPAEALAAPEVVEFEAQGLTQLEMKTRDHPPLQEGASGSYEVGICMVDTVTHIKQITGRPTYVFTTTIVSDGTEQANLSPRTIPNIGGACTPTYVHWVSELYAFSRGSYNAKFLPCMSRTDYEYSLQIGNGVTAVGSSAAIVPATYDFSGHGMAIFHSKYNPMFEATSPYYANCFGVITGVLASDWAHNNVNNVSVKVARGQGVSSVTDIGIEIYYSTGDDFAYHYQIGPPSTLLEA